MSQMNLKECVHNTIHAQLNNHTLPITPFKRQIETLKYFIVTVQEELRQLKKLF